MSGSPTIGLISVGATPPGTQSRDWRVYLDGVEQIHVVSANDAKGWIERYITDADGLVAPAGNEIAREHLKGKVRLVYTGTDSRYSAFTTL